MDKIICYTLAGGQARAFVAKTTDMAETARETHGLSHVATAALGRALTCGAIMAVQMKNDGDRMSFTINGGGPLGALTVAARPGGVVKGYVDEPGVELPLRPDGKLDVGAAVGARGNLTVIKDLGMREPYIGRVALQTGEIAEDFAYYFAASEQQYGAVALGVLTSGGRVASAGGVVIHPMPDCSDEVIAFIENCAPLLADVSGLFNGNTAEQVGELLFHPIEHQSVGQYAPRFECDCSRQRLERLLAGMDAAELADMIEKQHGAQITCHFCNKAYDFTEAELSAMLEARKAAAIAK